MHDGVWHSRQVQHTLCATRGLLLSADGIDDSFATDGQCLLGQGPSESVACNGWTSGQGPRALAWELRAHWGAQLPLLVSDNKLN